jgi:hypothetical protein
MNGCHWSKSDMVASRRSLNALHWCKRDARERDGIAVAFTVDVKPGFFGEYARSNG